MAKTTKARVGPPETIAEEMMPPETAAGKKKFYVFLQPVTYAPLENTHYKENTVSDLAGWAEEHIAGALKAGQIAVQVK